MVGSLEGPIYYYDQGSGKHILFVNAISGGAHSIEALWNDSIETSWNLNNRQTVVDWTSSQYNWANPSMGGNINLATVTDSGDKNKLFLFFGVRDRKAAGDNSNYLSYLFHDIGALELNLPLLTSEPVVKDPSLNDASLDTYVIRYVSSDSASINQMQFIISTSADWRGGQKEIRAMYIDQNTNIGGKNLSAGLYLYDNSNSENYGWGDSAAINTWKESGGGSKVLTWQVKDVSLPEGMEFNQYIWYVDANSGPGGITRGDIPKEMVVADGVNYNYQIVGGFINEAQGCINSSDPNNNGETDVGDLVEWYTAYR